MKGGISKTTAAPMRARRGIQSVEIGLRVLSALAADGPAPLSTIAQRAGLSASQAHRYLASLVAAGMAKQAARAGFYDLDSGALRLGLAALARLDLFVSADAVFAEFARETGRTCLLAVLGDAGPTVVRWFAGMPAVVTSLSVGSVLPLLGSATGQAFCGFADPGALVAHKADPAALAALRAAVRQAGVAEISGDVIPGLRAYAAPVLDLQGRLVLVATMLGNAAFPLEGDTDAARALRAACGKLTETLGGVPPMTDGG